MHKNSWIALLLLLASCTPLVTATPLPTSQVVFLSFTPAFQSWQETLQRCIANTPGASFFVDDSSTAPVEIAAFNINFRLGLPTVKPQTPYYSAQIGWEKVTVVVNQANPASSLSIEQLQGLFSGKIQYWHEILPTMARDVPVQAWAYLEGDEIRQAFEAAINPDDSLPLAALLAPDPQAMAEAVSAHPGAIGYLPERWLETYLGTDELKLKVMILDEQMEISLLLPVLAISNEEPQGAARALLLCMQETE